MSSSSFEKTNSSEEKGDSYKESQETSDKIQSLDLIKETSSTNGTPGETVSEANQEVLGEALEKVQGGIGLGMLRNDIRSVRGFQPGDTGNICSNHVTRRGQGTCR
jgi:hypothetical protein